MTVTIITGASRGIGAHLAQHYSELGHNVVEWSFSRNVDVADDRSIIRELSKLKRVDNLVHCAGIASMNSAMLMPTERAKRIFDTNAVGTFNVCREVAKVMARAKHGRIVNFSSIAVPMNLEGESVYAASKAAVETMTRIFAREFAPFGITVNAVGPNPIDTDLIRGVSKPKIAELLKRHAIPRMGTFADVANVCDFFLSDKSSAITGQVVYLGGA